MFDNINIRNLFGSLNVFGSLNFVVNDAPPVTPSPGSPPPTNDSQSGTEGLDVFIQESLTDSDTLNGGAGRDTVDYSRAEASDGAAGGIDAALAGGTVRKYVNGRLTGTDTLISIERVIGTRYNDTLLGSVNADALDGDGGNDILDGGGGNDTVSGGDGDDRIAQADWSSSTTIQGGPGFDTLDYSKLEVAWGLTVNLAIATVTKGQYGALSGTDTIDGMEAAIGTRFNDFLLGDASANRLDGGDGSDTLNGGAGNDIINGGAGHDHLVQDSAADSDTITGGDGDDRLSYMNADVSIRAELGSGNVEKFRDNTLVGADAISGIEHVIGTRFNDTMGGSANAEELGGYEGDDEIRGNAGNDTLKGYQGQDRLIGDAGNDSLEGGDGADDMTGGDGNDDMTGNDAADVLRGGAGNDTLSGGAAEDLLRAGTGRNSIDGGDGNDYILQGESGSIDTINGGDGVDIVDYSEVAISRTLPYGLNIDLDLDTVYTNIPLFSTLKDRISHVENVIGTNGHDKLTGDTDDNLLYGEAGNDVIDGGAGDDLLDGDAGNDVIYGGKGDDTFFASVFSGNDQLDGGDGNDTLNYENKEAGTSVVVDLTAGTALKYIDGVKVGSDKIHHVQSVIGTVNADKITGSANGDVLKGGLGNDTMSGAGENDSVCGEDGDDYFIGTWMLNTSIDGGDGVDTLDYSKLQGPADSSGVDIDLRSGLAQKIYDWLLLGVDSISNVEHIIGSNFDDHIIGDAGDNTISAAAGNDVLNGYGGNDLIGGGSGDDLILRNIVDDNATLDGGNGFDALTYGNDRGSIDVDLWAGKVYKYLNREQRGVDTIRNIEEVIGGSEDDTMSGGDHDDKLSGASGDDSLVGAGGGDNLNGGAGNDTLIGEAGNDMLDGQDGADLLSGGDGNDMLYGREGNDTLNGGGATDNIRAGSGDDLIIQDRLDESNNIDGSTGFDTLDYSLAAGGESGINANLVSGTVVKFINTRQLGTDTISQIEGIIGTRYNDTIIGSANFDRIDAGDGNDSINSGAGNDVIFAGDGSDRIVVSTQASTATIDGGAGFDMLDYSGANVFIVLDLSSQKVTKGLPGNLRTDTVSNIEGGIGTNVADILMGDAKANRLIGGSGNDTMYGNEDNDTLLGGSGDDYLIQLDASWNGDDSIDGGIGFNTLAYSLLENGGNTPGDSVSGRTVLIDLTDRTAQKYQSGASQGTDTFINIGKVIGSNGNDTVEGSGKADDIFGYYGNDRLSGSDGDDNLSGQSGNDTVNGDKGNDAVDGGEGADVLSGGAGNDTVLGGGGDDRLVQDAESGKDQLEGGGGFDTVDYGLFPVFKGLLTIDLDAGTVSKKASQGVFKTDKLASIEAAIGSQNSNVISGSKYDNNIIGGAADDYLDGLAGQDTIKGGAGADKLIGGSGNDSFLQDADSASGNDSIDGGSDTDSVSYAGLGGYITVDMALGKVVKYKGVELTGTDTLESIEAVAGTSRNDMMVGSANVDGLYGAGGNDTIMAKAGADVLGGQDGNDSLHGDAGADSLSGGSGADTLTGGADNDMLNGGDGDDYYYFDRNFGYDLIINPQASGSSENDVVKFLSAAPADVLFQRQGNTLKVYIAGTADMISFDTWYSESANAEAHDHVAAFVTSTLSLSSDRLDEVVTVPWALPLSMMDILMGG